MTPHVLFLTHADVVIDPDVKVPDWPLNDIGCARHARFARDTALADVTTLFCSAERKATDAAEITGTALGLTPQIKPELGENDRSATGYLPKDQFEKVADRFFAEPDTSVMGWERATDAQTRIVKAVKDALAEVIASGNTLFIGHGGTAALLRCHLLKMPISRIEDQPGNGGCWFSFGSDLQGPPSAWRVI